MGFFLRKVPTQPLWIWLVMYGSVIAGHRMVRCRPQALFLCRIIMKMFDLFCFCLVYGTLDSEATVSQEFREGQRWQRGEYKRKVANPWFLSSVQTPQDRSRTESLEMGRGGKETQDRHSSLDASPWEGCRRETVGSSGKCREVRKKASDSRRIGMSEHMGPCLACKYRH